jgi:hypothetical protein
MPFQAQIVSSTILSQMLARGFTGKNSKDLADAVATACSIHFLLPGTVSLILSGTAAGPGVYVPSPMVGVTGPAMSTLMIGKAASLGFKGKSMKDLFDSVSLGIVINLTTLIVTGVAVGVGIGSGVGRVTGFNQKALEGVMLAQFTSKGMIGKNVKDLCAILSTGIVNTILSSAVINVGVVGPIIPPPTGPVPVTGIPNTASFI